MKIKKNDFHQKLKFIMKKTVIFYIITLALFSCEREQLLEFCAGDFGIREKIKGGSILQTWIYFDGAKPPEQIVHTTDLAQKTNANWISLSPGIGLDNWWGHEPPYRYEFPVSAETEKMRIIIPKMRNSDLPNIMLKPLTEFWTVNGSTFRGDFYVDNEAQWKVIEAAYEKLIYGFAKLSVEFPEVKLLSIGTELREFTKRRPGFFKGLISKIRKDFPDLKLTYAANWDEYKHVSFWEDLDYIGINPYFPLVNKKTPTVAEVERAFAPIKQDIQALSCTYKKPVLFTEYGFRSADYGLWNPWELGSIRLTQTPNFEVQNNGYNAFYNTFWEEPWVAGGFFWEWRAISNGEVNNPNNNGWEVNDKPIEKIVKSRYTD